MIRHGDLEPPSEDELKREALGFLREHGWKNTRLGRMCRLWQYLREYWQEHGHGPTQEEIADQLEIQQGSVSGLLAGLRRCGSAYSLERGVWVPLDREPTI